MSAAAGTPKMEIVATPGAATPGAATPSAPKESAGAALLRSAAAAASADELFVCLDLKLVNFPYLDCKLMLKTSTPLSLLKRQISERHGRVERLRLFRDRVSPDNELLGDSRTLAQLGLPGKRRGDAPDTVVVWFDFVPLDATDPLLLATSSRDRVGVS